jgi:fructose-bisphosphate aldolase class II
MEQRRESMDKNRIRGDDFQQAIKAGMTIVHVNTELRLVWRRDLEHVLQAHPDEIAPYKLLPEVPEP